MIPTEIIPMSITSEQLNAALLERLALLSEVSDWGYITICVSGNTKEIASICVNVATRNTELTANTDDIDKAVAWELARHKDRKSAADEMRERAQELLKKAQALEAESLPA